MPLIKISSTPQVQSVESDPSVVRDNRYLPDPDPSSVREVDHPVMLKQSSHWAYLIIWLIVICTGGVVTWAAIFEIDEAVSAAGKLEPTAAVRGVQSPVGGVVKEIFVEEGAQIEANQILVVLDTRGSEADLTSTRAIRDALYQENQIYRAQLSGDSSQFGNLNPDKQALLLASQAEYNSRMSVLDLEIQQLSEQLQKAQTEVENVETLLNIDQEVLESVRPLYEEGGLPRIQLLRQQQQVDQRQATIDGLEADQRQIQAAIQQAQYQQQLAKDLSRKEILGFIADNEKAIATIERELAQAQVSRQYEEIQAPVAGTIFDLQTGSPGVVINPSQTIMKIVPPGDLVAQVFVTNQEIGFIQQGQPVDVRIDSFPYREFGDIKGEVIHIGSDALPPEGIHPYYRFPVKIELDSQDLTLTGRTVSLQSGMSVTANIKTRKRTVLSIFTEMITQNLESLQFVR